jgi:hypothetical protein
VDKIHAKEGWTKVVMDQPQLAKQLDHYLGPPVKKKKNLKDIFKRNASKDTLRK